MSERLRLIGLETGSERSTAVMLGLDKPQTNLPEYCANSPYNLRMEDLDYGKIDRERQLG